MGCDLIGFKNKIFNADADKSTSYLAPVLLIVMNSRVEWSCVRWNGDVRGGWSHISLLYDVNMVI